MIKNNQLLLKVVALAIVATAILLPIYCGLNQGKKFREQILKNPILLTGKLIKVEKAYKLSDAFTYEFFYPNTQLITSFSGSNMYYHSELYQDLIGKSFPIIANKEKPEQFSHILIDKGDFNEFDLPLPDSLRWVEKLKKER